MPGRREGEGKQDVQNHTLPLLLPHEQERAVVFEARGGVGDADVAQERGIDHAVVGVRHGVDGGEEEEKEREKEEAHDLRFSWLGLCIKRLVSLAVG